MMGSAVCERKSFNLEEALAGKKVVTIEGDEVTQLIQFESISYPDNIYGVVKGVIVCWNDDGSYSNTSNVKSLYMQDYIDIPKTVKNEEDFITWMTA